MAHHLIFELDAIRYALHAEMVRTTFWLPELSPVEDLPPAFVGMVDWHGQVVPILDLAVRFGHPPKPYRPSQVVILVEQGGQRVGLIADAAQDLIEVEPAAIEPYVQLENDPLGQVVPMIAGCVKWQDAVLILLDPAAFMRLLMQSTGAVSWGGAALDRFAHLDPLELEQLRRRTHQLAAPLAEPDADTHGFALVRIGANRFALAIETISEFTHLVGCTPLPCCPPHILGGINLRGAILVVLDLAPLLLSQALRDYREVVVLRLDEQRLGLAVHGIDDVRDYGPKAMTPLTGQVYGHQHCTRLLHDTDGVAGVLDLAALMTQGLLDVDEPT